jgi:hypothetical protein
MLRDRDTKVQIFIEIVSITIPFFFKKIKLFLVYKKLYIFSAYSLLFGDF